MKLPAEMPRLKGYRFPREVVAYAVWAYHRFAMSTADVEDLLAERGVIVSRCGFDYSSFKKALKEAQVTSNQKALAVVSFRKCD